MDAWEVLFLQDDSIVPWGHNVQVQEGWKRQSEPIRVLSWKLKLGLRYCLPFLDLLFIEEASYCLSVHTYNSYFLASSKKIQSQKFIEVCILLNNCYTDDGKEYYFTLHTANKNYSSSNSDHQSPSHHGMVLFSSGPFSLWSLSPDSSAKYLSLFNM